MHTISKGTPFSLFSTGSSLPLVYLLRLIRTEVSDHLPHSSDMRFMRVPLQ